MVTELGSSAPFSVSARRSGRGVLWLGIENVAMATSDAWKAPNRTSYGPLRRYRRRQRWRMAGRPMARFNSRSTTASKMHWAAHVRGSRRARASPNARNAVNPFPKRGNAPCPGFGPASRVNRFAIDNPFFPASIGGGTRTVNSVKSSLTDPITAFEHSPDEGCGHARDMSVTPATCRKGGMRDPAARRGLPISALSRRNARSSKLPRSRTDRPHYM